VLDRGPRTWALEMALQCLDLQTGSFIHFPRPGGWFEQLSGELEAMRIAWRAWKVFSKTSMRRTAGDKDFVDWMNCTGQSDG